MYYVLYYISWLHFLSLLFGDFLFLFSSFILFFFYCDSFCFQILLYFNIMMILTFHLLLQICQFRFISLYYQASLPWDLAVLRLGFCLSLLFLHCVFALKILSEMRVYDIHFMAHNNKLLQWFFFFKC